MPPAAARLGRCRRPRGGRGGGGREQQKGNGPVWSPGQLSSRPVEGGAPGQQRASRTRHIWRPAVGSAIWRPPAAGGPLAPSSDLPTPALSQERGGACRSGADMEAACAARRPQPPGPPTPHTGMFSGERAGSRERVFPKLREQGRQLRGPPGNDRHPSPAGGGVGALCRLWDTRGLRGGTRGVHGPGHGRGAPPSQPSGWKNNTLWSLRSSNFPRDWAPHLPRTRTRGAWGALAHTARAVSPGHAATRRPSGGRLRQRAGPGWASGGGSPEGRRGLGLGATREPRVMICRSWKGKRSCPSKRGLLGAGPQVSKAGLPGAR